MLTYLYTVDGQVSDCCNI